MPIAYGCKSIRSSTGYSTPSYLVEQTRMRRRVQEEDEGADEDEEDEGGG
jgi:hypothetical protein